MRGTEGDRVRESERDCAREGVGGRERETRKRHTTEVRQSARDSARDQTTERGTERRDRATEQVMQEQRERDRDSQWEKRARQCGQSESRARNIPRGGEGESTAE